MKKTRFHVQSIVLLLLSGVLLIPCFCGLLFFLVFARLVVADVVFGGCRRFVVLAIACAFVKVV